MFQRVAYHVASAEEHPHQYEDKFYRLLSSLDFLPNTPTLLHAGAPGHEDHSLSACFVLPIYDTLESIMETLKHAALIEKSGGGTGFGLSRIRPRGDKISTVPNSSLGPMPVLEMYSTSLHWLTQATVRRGAHMAQLHISHPDILEFIEVKSTIKDKDNPLSNFNISVQIPDSFFHALNDDGMWPLINPRTGETVNEISAKSLWDTLCYCAWLSGDPGCVFIDRVHETAPNPTLGPIESSNPCLLGSTRMLTEDGLVPISEINVATFATPDSWAIGSAWKTGNKNVQVVVLSNGQSITTTPDHKFVIGEAISTISTGFKVDPFIWKGDWLGREDFSSDTMVRLGFLFGDGSKCTEGGAYVHLGKDDQDVYEWFDDYKWHGSRRRYIPTSASLLEEFDKLGMEWNSLPDRQVPKELFYQSPNLVRSFLCGLFSANGSVLSKYHRINLKSTNLQAVRDIQILMLALGYRPYISTNQPRIVAWPNGEFKSRQSFGLHLSSPDLGKFLCEIGFIQTYKQSRLEEAILDSPSPSFRKQPKVVAVEIVGMADVYDFNVRDESHIGWANGFYVSNCGEEFLEPYGSCNLGSINLAHAAFEGSVDWDWLRDTVILAVRFLDNVITVNRFPDSVPQIRNVNLLTRRIGLGVMGWADLLDQLGISYDSDEALKWANHLSRFITRTAWDASEELAEQRGEFPLYPDSTLDDPATRNSSVTTIAPTGTISIIAGCSSGIEPHYSLVWTRKALWNRNNNGTEAGQLSLLECPQYIRSEIQRLGLDEEEVLGKALAVPDPLLVLSSYGIDCAHLRTAMEIEPAAHVKMLAAWQSSVTNSVSKTINLPSDATADDIGSAFQLAWNLNCKSVTAYRDGSKEIQVLNHLNCEECGGETRYEGGCRTCVSCGSGSCDTPYGG